jgi:long-subunit acyl-CoA synthetase (AMP-forming)
VVTVYATLGPDGVAQVMRECDAAVVFTSASLLASVHAAIAGHCPTIRAIVHYPALHAPAGEELGMDFNIIIF